MWNDGGGKLVCWIVVEWRVGMRSWVGVERLTGVECWTDELGVWDIECNKVVGWVEGSAGIAERCVVDIRMIDGDSMVRDGVGSSIVGKGDEDTGQRLNL